MKLSTTRPLNKRPAKRFGMIALETAALLALGFMILGAGIKYGVWPRVKPYAERCVNQLIHGNRYQQGTDLQGQPTSTPSPAPSPSPSPSPSPEPSPAPEMLEPSTHGPATGGGSAM